MGAPARGLDGCTWRVLPRVLGLPYHRVGWRVVTRDRRSGHLHQIVSYLQNAAFTSLDGPPWEGMLVYPAADASFRHR